MCEPQSVKRNLPFSVLMLLLYSSFLQQENFMQNDSIIFLNIAFVLPHLGNFFFSPLSLSQSRLEQWKYQYLILSCYISLIIPLRFLDSSLGVSKSPDHHVLCNSASWSKLSLSRGKSIELCMLCCQFDVISEILFLHCHRRMYLLSLITYD